MSEVLCGEGEVEQSRGFAGRATKWVGPALCLLLPPITGITLVPDALMSKMIKSFAIQEREKGEDRSTRIRGAGLPVPCFRSPVSQYVSGSQVHEGRIGPR